MAASRLSIWSILPSSRSPSRKLRSCPSWLASGSNGPPRAPRPVISRTRRDASFSATCAAETPSASADDHPGSVVTSGSSSTASWAAIPARRSSSNVPCSPAGRSAGVLKTSPTTIATSSAAAASPGRSPAAVAVSAARQAWCSARTCSSPSTKATSFLRPASASTPTSQAPRSSATKATPPLSRPHRQSGTRCADQSIKRQCARATIIHATKAYKRHSSKDSTTGPERASCPPGERCAAVAFDVRRRGGHELRSTTRPLSMTTPVTPTENRGRKTARSPREPCLWRPSGQVMAQCKLGRPAMGSDSTISRSGRQGPPLPDTDSLEALSSNIPSNTVFEFGCTRS